jgi:hypothetical protein
MLGEDSGVFSPRDVICRDVFAIEIDGDVPTGSEASPRFPGKMVPSPKE